MRLRRGGLARLLTATFLLASGCAREPAERALEPVSGAILISLDTVGADHLGAYGHARDTTPFFDRLADGGVLFERAFVQYPSTLVSHLSMFTGLYPQQHGVYPPSKVLAPGIEMLPERFQRLGFRTAGHTEGGFVNTHFGFDRGFDEFEDPIIRQETDVERTFDRGLEFLGSLAPGERFFLFLHTYTAHDPYEPPEPFRGTFWKAPPPPTFDSHKDNLAAVNRGELEIDAVTIDYFHARYDEGLRYLDAQLERLFAGIEALGLRGRTAIIVTSDHGEEFLEHGRLGHSQVYPETLRVPLLVLHPRATPGRVAAPVESIDLAPTLFELAGLEVPTDRPGSSLAPWLFAGRGRSIAVGGDGENGATAYAEVTDNLHQRTLIEAVSDELWQTVVHLPPAEPDGIWVTRETAFDAAGAILELEAVAFAEPRRLRVTIDGVPAPPVSLGTDWGTVRLELPGPGRHRVRLSADGCTVPKALGMGEDPRCLSFKLRGTALRRTELFGLTADPGATTDLSRDRPELHRRLLSRLAALSWMPVEEPARPDLPPETEEALRALGYVN